MADLTEAEEERIEPQPHVKANIPAIANLVDSNGLIAKAEEKAAKARGELGRHYQKVENDFHGNRKAVKLIRTLLGGTTDAAYDFMRTFIPLAERFELIPEDDLVSKAEKGTGAAAGEGVVPFRRKSSGLSALDSAREHLSGGTKPDAATDAERQKRERKEAFGFDENPPPGEEGDVDLANAGGSETSQAAE